MTVRCDVCKSLFLDFESDPGRGQRVYRQHLLYCDARADLKRLKKKTKKREQEMPEWDAKFEIWEP